VAAGPFAARVALMNRSPTLPGDRPLRIHDLGCGYGAFVAYLRKAGHNATGTDLDEAAVRYGQSVQGNEHISISTFADYCANSGERFDVVFLNHVLEHIRDPIGLIKEVAARLTDIGIIVMYTPNGAYALFDWGHFYDWTWFQYPSHLHHLTRYSMGCLARETGLAIQVAETTVREDLPNRLTAGVPQVPAGDSEAVRSFILDAARQGRSVELSAVVGRQPAPSSPLVIDPASERGMHRQDLAPPESSAEFYYANGYGGGWRYEERVNDVVRPLAWNETRTVLHGQRLDLQHRYVLMHPGACLRIVREFAKLEWVRRGAKSIVFDCVMDDRAMASVNVTIITGGTSTPHRVNPASRTVLSLPMARPSLLAGPTVAVEIENLSERAGAIFFQIGFR
jgi:SAM-dependent methyltransferase